MSHEDIERRHRENIRAAEEQTRALEAQARQIELQRREAQRRYEEQQEKEEFAEALPECKYCGQKIPYDSQKNFYEYCSKKCICSDLGDARYDDYMANGEKMLSMQLDELIANEKKLTAAIVSKRMSNFTREQRIFLANAFASSIAVIGGDGCKAADFLQPIFDSLSAPRKLEMIYDIKTTSKYVTWEQTYIASRFLEELFEQNPGVVTNCERRIRHKLLKILSDLNVNEKIFRVLLFMEMAPMDMEHKKEFTLDLIDGKYNVPGNIIWSIIDLIFKCIGNSDKNFTKTIYDLVISGSCPQSAESKTLREIINCSKLPEKRRAILTISLITELVLMLVFLHNRDADLETLAGIMVTVFVTTVFVIFIIITLALGIMWSKNATKKLFNKKINKEIEPEKAFLLDDFYDDDDELSLDDDDDDELSLDNGPGKKANSKRPSVPMATVVSAAPVATVVSAAPVTVPAEPVAVPAEPVVASVPNESQMIKFYCIHCGKKIKAQAEWIGMEGDCPRCGKVFIIPEISVNQK